ncbi:hypothetical protein KP803_08565 [Vibrio sp. ZSDE26]|uniref:Uncharacterized protein n=1 Tax=Vibrio amylolyticus TaxID=2847292 RepID=A0A9X2BHS9_9VIBR|nr:hypothetical protein [Vibrio amylolyticus]MCK6263330.1 hypothetical protein [Vibrio amylolyticus]
MTKKPVIALFLPAMAGFIHARNPIQAGAKKLRSFIIDEIISTRSLY